MSEHRSATEARRSLGPVAVLVPVKAFGQAKVRLAPALTPDARAALARAMAEHVLAVCAPLPTAVVCDDADVAAWARAHGARIVWEPGRGLNRMRQQIRAFGGELTVETVPGQGAAVRASVPLA